MEDTVTPTDMPMVSITDLQLTSDFEQQWQGWNTSVPDIPFYPAVTSVVLIALVCGLASVKLPSGSCGLSVGSIAGFTPEIK